MAEQYLEVHGNIYDFWDKQRKREVNSSQESERRFSQNEEHPQVKNSEHEGGQVQKQVPSKTYDKRRCYLCNRVGHIARDCFRQGGTQKGHTAIKESTALQCQEVRYFTLENGIKIPMVKEGENTFMKGAGGKTLNVLGLSMQPGSKMPVVEGQVNGGTNLVSVLRDTGCSGTVIKRSLCKDSALTGEVKPCLMINGQVIRVPVAEIQVHTPYFSGDIKAMVMENPFHDLVIGNLKGARDAGDPDLEWKPNIEEWHAVTGP